ncbi:MAG: hypothetical protein KatS3mg076_1531 [Candidatus Binatia bacterium]|nr:MAG: hypothetical protein KatS3mg076_1531 [Candidatus Binatia bacterium]
MSGAEAETRPAWKTYPFVLCPDDPELVFPGAEGDQGAESNTYYVAGRLVGRKTGRQWAFLTIFAYNNVRHRLRADFHTLALFDLGTGEYGTFTEFDLPRPPRIRMSYKLSVARGYLDVSFRSAEGPSRWATRRDAEGDLLPFEYELSVYGRDAAGRRMHLELDLDPRKPPVPVGGEEYRGRKTCIGQYGTHSYFQSDVRFSGRLEWGEVSEEVEGDAGWIDRQWAPRQFGVHNDRRGTRYRHEWREIHLDNGLEMSVWVHFDRGRTNRVIPFTGATAVDREARVRNTTEIEVEWLSFVRDPRQVRPLARLTEGPAYFGDRYRLRVPAWGLELFSESIVPAPAHRLPIEYWSGPTRLRGSMEGRPVEGFGFYERTHVFARDFELVDVLRKSVRHLPESAVPRGALGPLEIANRVWEIDAFLSHGDRKGALRYLGEEVRPHLASVAEPYRGQLLTIARDLETVLGG